MNSYDNVGWRFIEEAVIRDKGYDEEEVLTTMLQSHFIRHGFVNSLKAFNDELLELNSGRGSKETAAHANVQPAKGAPGCRGDNDTDSNAQCGGDECIGGVECRGSILKEMHVRKCVQVLCRSEDYAKAASLLPNDSEMKVRLLTLEAVKRSKQDRSAAISFLCTQVGPMIYKLPNAVAAHHIFVESLGAVAGVGGAVCEVPSPCAVAREVNESLLESSEPSALDVLLLWSELQVAARAVEKDLLHKANFPFRPLALGKS